MRHSGDKQHDDGGYRRHSQGRIKGGNDRKRRHRDGKDDEQRQLMGVGYKDGDCATIEGAAKGTEQVIDGRLERSANAHLGHDDRGQNRPQGQWQSQP